MTKVLCAACAAVVFIGTPSSLGQELSFSPRVRPGQVFVKEGIAGASCGGTPVTQNTNPDVIVTGTLACLGPANTTADNFLARTYFISSDLVVKCVDFAIESSNGAGGGNWPVRVRLYSDTNGGAPNTASLVQKGPDVVVNIPNGTVNGFFTATFPSGGVLINAGTTLVVELYVPCRVSSCTTNPPGFPPGDGFATFLGTNNLGQSGPTYFKGPSCGLTDFVSLTALGFPNIHVIQVLGTSPPANPCNQPIPPCQGDISPPGGNGLVDVDDLLAVINTWGDNGNPSGPRPQGDCAPLPNGNCLVDVDDLLGVINTWGPCDSPTGACCLPNGTCLSNQTSAACATAGGIYQGNGASCGSVSCPVLPANDECANAVVVHDGINNVTNVNATTSSGIPLTAGCVFQGPQNFTRDVWFSYTATCTGMLTVDLCGTGGAVTDTVMALYTGPCGNLAELACDDDGCPDSPSNSVLSKISLHVTTGQQMLIRAGSWNNGPTGPLVLTVTCTADDNDFCDQASPIAIGDSASGTLANIEPQQDVGPPCNGLQPQFGRWYTVIGNGNTLTASTCSGPTQTWNAILNVYCGSTCDNLFCVTAANNNTCNNFQESVSWCSALNQKYWILVHSAIINNPANYTLTVTNGASCPNPLTCGLANDECAGATTVVNGSNFINIGGATTSAGTPGGACTGSASSFTNDAWYVYTPTATGFAEIKTCESPGLFDTLLSVLSGPCDSLTELACDDDGCGVDNGFSRVIVPVTQGVAVRIRLGMYNNQPGGSMVLTIVPNSGGCPACTGATLENLPCRVDGDVAASDPNGGCNSVPSSFSPPISSGATVCGIGSTYTNSGGTTSRDTDWYLFTPGVSGNYTITGCASFSLQIGFIENAAGNITLCGAGQKFVGDSSVIVPPFTTGSITRPLAAGQTYAVFISSELGATVPCPPAGQTNYRFTLTGP